MSDVLTKEQRHKNMQHIRSKDTKIELLLRKALWQKGIRYRKNYTKITGKPDIAIMKYKIAVFCDSEFFHGKDWEEQKARLLCGDNGEFWVKKISCNIVRDNKVNQDLRAIGWTVIRFWGKEIKYNVDECIKVIEETIFDMKMDEDECSDQNE